MANRWQVPLFLLLTFGWAWLLWGYWAVAMPPGGLRISPAFIICAIVGGLAPSLAAIAVSALAGRQALATLLKPLTQAQASPSLYLAAFLLVPLTSIVSAGVQLAVIGPLHWPDPALLLMAMFWPIMAALGEEIGWRGYLQPRLEPRLGIVGSAIVVGLLWGLWHLPADYVALKGYGAWFPAAFLLNGPIVLTAHAIILAWIWHRSGGSLLLAVLYHWSITASAIAIPGAGSDGVTGLIAAAIGATLMWIAAATLLVQRRADFQAALGVKVSDTPFMQ